MSKNTYRISFRCYFPGGHDQYTTHYQELELKQIPKWIEAYRFTHPDCTAISIRLNFQIEA